MANDNKDTRLPSPGAKASGGQEKIKENYDVKKARKIVLDTIGEDEKEDEEKINIKVVPGGFGEKSVSKPDSNWGGGKEESADKPKKEFVTVSPEPTQKFIDEIEPEKKPEEKKLTGEEIEMKKAQIQEEMEAASEKPVEVKPEKIKKEKTSGKQAAPKTAKEPVKKKIKPKKPLMEIPVELSVRKNAPSKKPVKISLIDFFGKARIINAVYMASYIFIAGIIFYLLFAMSIYNFNPDNFIARKIASFLPVPAIISSEGLIEYYDYQDYLKYFNYDYDKTKTVLIRQIIYRRIIKKNPLASPDEINEEIIKGMKNVKLWSVVD